MQASLAPSADTAKKPAAYQFLLVLVLSLNFGIVFFDRQALNFLMPFVGPELDLSQTQIGIIGGGLSFTWALAAFGVGKLSDAIGNRKLLLVLSTVAFSLCSFLTGLASTFAFLLGARLLMGVAEGGVMPISHAMVATEVSDERRGLAQGVAQNLGSNLLGSFIAPIVLVWVAQTWGWREAFYIAAVPGLISAAIIWFFLEEPAAPKSNAQSADITDDTMSILKAMKIRNIWICVVMGVLLVGHFVITFTFMPIYLTEVRGFDPQTMSYITSTLGAAAAFYSFTISALSDKIGRKPVMVALPFLALIGPLGALYYEGSAIILGAIFFIGWAVNGIFPIFMATIPSETVHARHHATVLGLAMGSCEILGGVFGPPLAGVLNDAFGLTTFLWMLMGLSLVAGVFGLFLKETAPAVLARRNAAH